MATNTITGLTDEQEAQRQQLAHQRGQSFFGGIANQVAPFLDPTDPTNYLGFGGKVGKGLFALAASMKAPEAQGMVLGRGFTPEMMTRASQMLQAGASEGRILQETGLVKVPKGPNEFTWGKQISDKDVTINPEALSKITDIFAQQSKYSKQTPVEQVALQDLLKHPELFKEYPELGKINIQAVNGFQSMGGIEGFYNSAANVLGIKQLNPYMTTPEQVASQLKDRVSTLLHEAQHGIQDLEKWPRGGNTAEFGLQSTTKAQEVVNTADKALDSAINATFLSVGKQAPYKPASLLKDALAYKQFGEPALKYVDDVKKEQIKFILNSGKFDDFIKTEKRINKVADTVASRHEQANKQYRSLAGEAQSRAVQTAFTEGNPRSPVTSYYDIQPSSLIYKDPFSSTIK